RLISSYPQAKGPWRGRRGDGSCAKLLGRRARDLFDREGAAMARGRQVGVPAGNAAEIELHAAGVAGRHRASPVLRAHGDRLATHRADSEAGGHAEIVAARATIFYSARRRKTEADVKF